MISREGAGCRSPQRGFIHSLLGGSAFAGGPPRWVVVGTASDKAVWRIAITKVRASSTAEGAYEVPLSITGKGTVHDSTETVNCTEWTVVDRITLDWTTPGPTSMMSAVVSAACGAVKLRSELPAMRAKLIEASVKAHSLPTKSTAAEKARHKAAVDRVTNEWVAGMASVLDKDEQDAELKQYDSDVKEAAKASEETPVEVKEDLKEAPPPAPQKPEPEPVVAKAAPGPARIETALVDFRIRPYASVFVNGTFYGVTPFAKVKLNVGTHSVRLVNKDIGKEITLSYEVKPGENKLIYNLETAE